MTEENPDRNVNPKCNADGTCSDINAQCVNGLCGCKYGYFFKDILCGKL